MLVENLVQVVPNKKMKIFSEIVKINIVMDCHKLIERGVATNRTLNHGYCETYFDDTKTISTIIG